MTGRGQSLCGLLLGCPLPPAALTFLSLRGASWTAVGAEATSQHGSLDTRAAPSLSRMSRPFKGMS